MEPTLLDAIFVIVWLINAIYCSTEKKSPVFIRGIGTIGCLIAMTHYFNKFA